MCAVLCCTTFTTEQSQLTCALLQSQSLEEAKLLAMTILKQVMEEDVTPTNVEVATVDVASGRYRVASAAEIEELIEVISKRADEQQ
jgi:20S proteasome alpha/beta subunit